MQTYVVMMVKRGKDDRERRKTVYVKTGNISMAHARAMGREVNGWRVVRVSEGGYH